MISLPAPALSKYAIIALTLASLLLLIDHHQKQAEALSREVICQNCQRILSALLGHHKTQSTRRYIGSKIKHLCNRYFDYRRHCIHHLLPKVSAIYADLGHYSNTGNNTMADYETRTCCVRLGECD